jgi:ABC-type multidrug transport system fused ATPase/permease subunit
VRASQNLHSQLIQRVLGAPTSFFDKTPVGRIVTRFSKDMDQVDLEVPGALGMYIFCVMMVVFAFGMVIYSTPWLVMMMMTMPHIS